jgi:hypothetical protein
MVLGNVRKTKQKEINGMVLHYFSIVVPNSTTCEEASLPRNFQLNFPSHSSKSYIIPHSTLVQLFLGWPRTDDAQYVAWFVPNKVIFPSSAIGSLADFTGLLQLAIRFQGLHHTYSQNIDRLGE